MKPTYTVVEVKEKLSGITREDFEPLDKLLTEEWARYDREEQIMIRSFYSDLLATIRAYQHLHQPINLN